MKTIITIWLQVKSAGLPERWLSIDAGISPIQILTKNWSTEFGAVHTANLLEQPGLPPHKMKTILSVCGVE
jgi:hypothetical protein